MHVTGPCVNRPPSMQSKGLLILGRLREGSNLYGILAIAYVQEVGYKVLGPSSLQHLHTSRLATLRILRCGLP